MLSGWDASKSTHFTLTARRNPETSRSLVQPKAVVKEALWTEHKLETSSVSRSARI